MAIWKLIKAQFKHKKAVYISLFLLTLLISFILTFAFSMSKNISEAAEEAYQAGKYGDVCFFYIMDTPSEEELEKLAEREEVRDLRKIPVVFPLATNAGIISDYKIATPWFQAYNPDIFNARLLRDDMKSYVPKEDASAPSDGEVYVANLFHFMTGAEIGDSFHITSTNFNKEYRISGFVEDLRQVNAVNMGGNSVFLSANDYEDLAMLAQEFPAEFCESFFLSVDKAPEFSDLSDDDFVNVISRGTDIKDMARIILTGEQVIYFSSIMSQIIAMIIIFVALLMFIANLLILNFNINSSLEAEYKNIGVLKACGLQKGHIQRVYLLSFLLTIGLGFGLGLLIASPVVVVSTPLLLGIFNLLVSGQTAWLLSSGAGLVILVIALLMMLVQLRKVTKIKPREALNEGQQSVYFSQGIDLQLKKPFLHARLSVKQFTASLHQYLSAVLLIAVLFFLVLYTYSLTNILESERMVQEFYGLDFDIAVRYEDTDSETKEKTEAVIEEYTPILSREYMEYADIEVNKNSLGLFIADNTKVLSSLLEGKKPEFDNEIILTKLFAQMHNIQIGDMVEVYSKGKTEDYLVSGFFQSLNRAGMMALMKDSAFRRLDVEDDQSNEILYKIEDPSYGEEIAEKLFQEVPELYVISSEGIQKSMTGVDAIFAGISWLMLGIALLFVIINGIMVSVKIFYREAADFGIFKAIGIRNSANRLIFSCRFLFVAFAGILIGYVLQLVLAPQLNNLLAPMVGVSTFVVKIEWFIIIIFALLFLIAFFLIAWAVSGRIKRLEIRNLVNAI
ncbi:MAG: FtsX-like permease family protein [Clostridiaceae bacterium]|nr:FtsX-like permease family protein [Clostridiaceae bacterium]